jgi:CheY-like chemotaxis protein
MIIPMKLPNFRAALVIAADSGLRKSIVQQLKDEGWIVHGITKAEHALPIFAHIPYELIIVDSELPGIDGKDFVHLLHNAGVWRAIHLVALTDCTSAPLAPGLAHLGAFSASREAWSDDLAHFLGQLAIENG